MGTAFNAFMVIFALLLLVACIGMCVWLLLWLAFGYTPSDEYKNNDF